MAHQDKNGQIVLSEEDKKLLGTDDPAEIMEADIRSARFLLMTMRLKTEEMVEEFKILDNYLKNL